MSENIKNINLSEKDIIGIDNLNKKIYYNNKYLLKDGLIHLMYEVRTDEIALTKQGLDFLKNAWGFENVANILFDYENGQGDFKISFNTREKLVEWLNNYHIINESTI